MSNNNVNEFNRPSVIVFNPNYNNANENRPSVIVSNNNAVSDDNIVNENIDFNEDNFDDNISDFDQDNFDALSQDSFEDYFDNHDDLNVDDEHPRGELSEEQYLSLIRSNYEMQERNKQYSTMYGVLFSHFKTVINPAIYEELQPSNFIDLFRDIVQDIFNRLLEKINIQYPNKFERVKINITGADLNVNLPFVPLSDLSSELFLIELYKVLQSRRDIVTSTEMALSFTFLPKPKFLPKVLPKPLIEPLNEPLAESLF